MNPAFQSQDPHITGPALQGEGGLEVPRVISGEPVDGLMERRVTRMVFVPDTARSSEVLFVFGTVQMDWDRLAAEILGGHYDRLILAGKTGPNFDRTGRPIALDMLDQLEARGVPRDLPLLQEESTNTLEDVSMSLSLIGRPKAITFAAKAHHSGRCARTLAKFFPKTQLYALTHCAQIQGVKIDAHTWNLSDTARGYVLGEYERILRYGSRGDIALYL